MFAQGVDTGEGKKSYEAFESEKPDNKRKKLIIGGTILTLVIILIVIIVVASSGEGSNPDDDGGVNPMVGLFATKPDFQ